jgi:phosphoadenosine phosphosulfate reductase
MPANPAEIEASARRLRNASPSEIVSWAMREFGNRLSIASSFSVEDCVVIDLAMKAAPGDVRVFSLDTGRLPDETYLTAERVRMKYGVEITWFFPERAAVEKLIRLKGLYSFRDSLDERHECCGIRKVEPLARALAGARGWVTGLRADQSAQRRGADLVEADRARALLKLNPLLDWTRDQAADFARRHEVPVNPLHDKGFLSIGCAPCTRAVRPGEPERAGRWWWEDDTKKECGLHLAGDRPAPTGAAG